MASDPQQKLEVCRTTNAGLKVLLGQKFLDLLPKPHDLGSLLRSAHFSGLLSVGSPQKIFSAGKRISKPRSTASRGYPLCSSLVRARSPFQAVTQ